MYGRNGARVPRHQRKFVFSHTNRHTLKMNCDFIIIIIIIIIKMMIISISSQTAALGNRPGIANATARPKARITGRLALLNVF